jgi:hypothetical protein
LTVQYAGRDLQFSLDHYPDEMKSLRTLCRADDIRRRSSEWRAERVHYTTDPGLEIDKALEAVKAWRAKLGEAQSADDYLADLGEVIDALDTYERQYGEV